MLIFEGADCVGKTTLANAAVYAIQEKGVPAVYQHMTKPPECFHRYYGYINLALTPVVKDRFHMSENIYCIARGEQPTIPAPVYKLLDAHFRLLGAYTVIIDAPDNVICQRLEESTDEMYSSDIVLKAAAEYRKVINSHSDYHYMDWDLTLNSTEIKKERILDVANVIADKWIERQNMVAELID